MIVTYVNVELKIKVEKELTQKEVEAFAKMIAQMTSGKLQDWDYQMAVQD